MPSIDSTSHTPEEINTLLLNKMESLVSIMESLNASVKKNTEAVNASAATQASLKATIVETNKTFEQVSQNINELKTKVSQIEIVAKLWKQFGPAILGGLGGGLGGLGKP